MQFEVNFQIKLKRVLLMLLILLICCDSFLGIQGSSEKDSCDSKVTCSDCIQSPDCSWCLQSDAEYGRKQRCFQTSNSTTCPPYLTYFPTSELQISENVAPSAKTPLRPQFVQIKLKPHDPYSFHIQHFINNTIGENIQGIKLKDNATNHLRITYSNCLAEATSNECILAKDKNSVSLKIQLELLQCPPNSQEWTQIIAVAPRYFAHQSLLIALEMICSCPCEQPGSVFYEEHSRKCMGYGTYTCGICECEGLHYGPHCECRQTVSNAAELRGCKRNGSPDEVECSGRGTCVCEQCECNIRENPNETISGRYCECDNFSCDRHDGKICGGHGKCECGQCHCEPPWEGPACDCYKTLDTCYQPFKKDAQMCSGHGECSCGRCQCATTADGPYSGRFCETCPNCLSTCDELTPCVLCQMYQTGPHDKDACLQNCSNIISAAEEVVQADEDNREFLCSDYEEDNCKYAFVYKSINETHYLVKAQRERECPEKNELF